MFEEDRIYYAARAAAERALAAAAEDPMIARIHSELATRYDERSRGDEVVTMQVRELSCV
jgi:hypothetical protein